jgi:hypothetical protein
MTAVPAPQKTPHSTVAVSVNDESTSPSVPPDIAEWCHLAARIDALLVPLLKMKSETTQALRSTQEVVLRAQLQHAWSHSTLFDGA